MLVLYYKQQILESKNVTFSSSTAFIVGKILRHINEKSIRDPNIQGFVFLMH